jgi:hypothetical protein
VKERNELHGDEDEIESLLPKKVYDTDRDDDLELETDKINRKENDN